MLALEVVSKHVCLWVKHVYLKVKFPFVQMLAFVLKSTASFSFCYDFS